MNIKLKCVLGECVVQLVGFSEKYKCFKGKTVGVKNEGRINKKERENEYKKYIAKVNVLRFNYTYSFT